MDILVSTRTKVDFVQSRKFQKRLEFADTAPSTSGLGGSSMTITSINNIDRSTTQIMEDEVPTAPQISRNSEQSNTAPLIYDAKTKPKRAKKRDTEQIIELQLAESKAKISNLEELNKEYRTTIDMLSVKLGIPSPVGYSNSHPTMTHATSISALESKMEHQIEKLRMDFQHQMQIMSLELRHTSEINELKLKLQLKETECNNIMQNSSLGANSNTYTIPSNNWYGFSMRNTQQTNPPPNWYGMPGHNTHATYQPTPPPVYQHMRPQVVINPYGRQPYQTMPATNLQHPSIPSFIQRSHHPQHTGNSHIHNQRHRAMHEQIPTQMNNKGTKQQQKVINTLEKPLQEQRKVQDKPPYKPTQTDNSTDIGIPTTANEPNHQHSTTTINREKQKEKQTQETNKHSTEQHFLGVGRASTVDWLTKTPTSQ
ncbi:Hypothetical predicted protein [Mytilus galloprovincialis]|uniref:Uncharacterized protein n=1 Tax=Mytilus galloprovincialis TaxID=29158 RepID=A0A8B6CY83_MYTGA|nr:Hypothetical predicted protein [Mytilus galloprovincialis]